MPPKRRSQTNPQPPLTQETVDQLVQDGIEAAIRAERERVKEEETRAGGPAGGPVARECTFTGFMKCGPKQFYGIEGAVGLCRWFEKMESTFGISERAERRKVKFVTATLHGRALTWWNSQVATLGLEVANGKPWTELRDTNIAAYTERFNELALLCPDAFPNENKKVELYIKGLLEIIKGETTSSRPAMLNDVVRIAHTLIEQKIQAKNERNAEGNKRRWENNNQGGNNNRNNNDNRGNNNNRKNNNRNNNNRNNNNRNNRGNYRDNNQYNQRRAMTAAQNNVVDQADRRGGNVAGQPYALRNTEQGQGPNVVTSTFLLNNRYARVLFDSGSDKSFVNSGFSHLIDIKPMRLNISYEVELADGKLVSTNTVRIYQKSHENRQQTASRTRKLQY
ncbi:hypothetical protein Tco_0949741 [Tanacetum coccineum]